MKTFRFKTSGLLLILTAFCLSYACAQVQQIQFNPVRGTNGISLGKINSIISDKYGFLWFSDQSNRCIIQFDGSHMTRFQNNPRDSNTLGGYYPECLFADKQGNIWIGFYGMGLDKYDPVNRTFTHYRSNKSDPGSLSNDFVSAVLEDHLGNLWVGTSSGLDLLDKASGKFQHFINDPKDTTSLSCNTVRALYEDRSGVLWIGTGFPFDEVKEGGLNRFHRSTKNFTRYRSDPANPQTLAHDKVRAIFEDSRGNFWVGTMGDGLHTMDRKTGSFTRHRYDPAKPNRLSRGKWDGGADHVTFITEDAEKQVWIGTLMAGITRYDPVADTFIRYGNRQDQNNILEDSTSWCALATPDGNVWITTQRANIFKVDLNNTVLGKYGNQTTDKYYTFLGDDTLRWFGTGNGLLRKDLRTGETVRFVPEAGNANSLSDKTVYRIIKDRTGCLWIGTDNGLNKFDPHTRRFTRYHHYPTTQVQFANSFISLYEDVQSNIWAGTYFNGLMRMDRESGKWTSYKNDPANANTISTDAISAIIGEDSTYLWLGTYNNSGLNKLNRRTGEFTHYLPGLVIMALFRDAAGVLWVGSPSGLFRYNKTADAFYASAEENAGNNIVQIAGITADKENNLWISTATGLYTLNKKRDQVSHYGNQFGVPATENFFFDGSAYTMPDGEINFGYAGGYLAFNPGKLKKGKAEARLYITGFWLNNKEMWMDGSPQGHVNNTKYIELKYNQNVFSFAATTVDYRNIGNKQIFYKLENYDRDWRSSRPQERMHYFKIPPGDYTFRVRTANPTNGDWLEKSMAIIISPPWWTTWWAYALYALSFVTAMYFVHRYQRERLIKAEREKTQLKELAQAREIEKAYKELQTTQAQLIQSEKMASLGELTAGIAHEIQNPLNFVNNFSEVNSELVAEMKAELSRGNIEEARILADDIDDNEKKINHHGKRADAIVKSMLQHSRSSSRSKEPTLLNNLVDEYVRLAYHGHRAKNATFNASLDLQYDERIGTIEIIAADMGRVLLNLLNNAFYAVSEKTKILTSEKKAYEPTITVRTKLHPASPGSFENITISITDNGTGIPPQVLDKIFQPFFTSKPTGQGTGLGLSLAYDIIKAHGGIITVNSTPAIGTTFNVQIPVR